MLIDTDKRKEDLMVKAGMRNMDFLVALRAWWLGLCLIMASAWAWPGHVRAQTQMPQSSNYWCVGGICLGTEANDTWYHAPCPTGSIASLKSCSEASYNSFLVSFWGGLTYLGMTMGEPGVYPANMPILNWQSQYNGNYQAILSPLSTQDNPNLNQNLGAQAPPNCGGTEAGNPINLSNGNKFQDEVDYRCEGAFPLRFHRYYNSLGSGDGTIGMRWSHTYSRTLGLSLGTQIQLFRDDGRVVYFTQCGTLWCPTADHAGVLTQLFDSTGNYTTGWQYVDESQTTENYDSTGRFLSETDRSGFTHNLTYDSSGNLSQVTDSSGRQINLSYNTSNLIQSIVFPDGTSLTYSYDTSNNLSTVTYPDGGVRTYLYNESGLAAQGASTNLLTGIRDESGGRYATYTYDGQSRALSSTHANGSGLINLAYQADGSVLLTDALQASRTYTFSTVLDINHIASVAGSDCVGCNLFANYNYNSASDLTGTADFNGHTTTYTVNSAHLEEQRVDAYGTTNQRTTTTTWNTALRVPLTRSVQDASGNTVSQEAWVYNLRGQVTAHCLVDTNVPGASSYACGSSHKSNAGVRQWTYTYCNAVDDTQCPLIGLLLSQSGPRVDIVNTTTYAYYSTDTSTYRHGDLRSVTDPLGHVTTINAYDGAGRITRITDANGVITDLTYTPRGWLATRIVRGNPDGSSSSLDAITTISYTAYGAVASITDPDGVVTNYTYDAAHRLTKITDALGNFIQYSLDPAGNRIVEAIYANGSSTPSRSLGRTYNMLGQLTRVTDGLNNVVFDAGTSGAYDGNGNLLQSRDAAGTVTSQSYDALNRLVKTIQDYNGTNTGTANSTIQQSYDALDRLTQVTDPSGLATIYSYNGLSDLVSEQSPDSGTTQWGYGTAGIPGTRTDARGIAATYTYDALNRVTTATYPDTSKNVAYYYDEANSITGCPADNTPPIGRLTRIVESGVTTVFCFNSHGKLVQKQQTIGTNTDTMRFTYTAGDRLARLWEPDGTILAYTYDATGRPNELVVTPPGTTTAITVISNVTYRPFGPIAGYTMGNGQVVTRTYDANDQLTDLISTPLNLHFVRDALGRIIAEGNAAGVPIATETYSYDPLSRLTGVSQGGIAIEALTYNGTGDRLSKVGGTYTTGAYGYQTNTHRLISTGNYPRTVDADGNTTAATTSNGLLGFGYDNRNRLAAVTTGNATVATYIYNALGERVSKHVGTTTTTFDYDEQSNLLSETTGSTHRDYVSLAGMPVAVVDVSGSTGTVDYVIADHLGAPRAVVNGMGVTQWQWPYVGNAFGEQAPISSTGYVYNPRFPGQYYDAESGLNYNVHRHYEPAIGGYDQPDPLGLAAGPSMYAYVGSDPLSYIDPLGLMSYARSWAAGGAITGGTIVAGGSVVVDVYTGGLNIAATGPEIAGGAALGGLIGLKAGQFADWVTGNRATGAHSKAPENAYDPEGPKAPGKPGSNEGFADPKDGENWVPNPNPGAGGASHGWEDAKGRVWCPTGKGGRAHGGSHWDVQLPGGGYINVRPGQNINDL